MRINDKPHPSAVLERIETIQRDFLSLIDPHEPNMTERFIAQKLSDFSREDTIEALVLELLRLTKYQNPTHLREFSLASTFVLDCFSKYESPPNFSVELLDLQGLDSVPFATVSTSSLTGFVYEADIDMSINGSRDGKMPCILLSENCLNTALTCSYVHNLLKGAVDEAVWKSAAEGREEEVPIEPRVADAVIRETLAAFLCDKHSSIVTRDHDFLSNNIEASRLLLSYLLAHEYSHVCLCHLVRRNEESPLLFSSFRLRDLAYITEILGHIETPRLPINSDRLRYFFGYQQDELDADLLAFQVLYAGIQSQERCEEVMPLFFRQVFYSILWSEINEVVGRSCLHGNSWSYELLHNPQLGILSDVVWRGRYPSAYSRVHYLHDRAKLLLTEEHLKVLEREIGETVALFSLWRNVILGHASSLEAKFKSGSSDNIWLWDSFVWKGMPDSAKGSIGYNDPTDAFRVYRWQDNTQV